MASTAVATIAYLFFEMPIATLWSYVMMALVGHTNRKRDEIETNQKKETNKNDNNPSSSL